MNDNKKVWKIVKPLFSEKVTANGNITLVDNNNIIFSDIGIAEKLNTFFSNLVKELNIKIKEDLLSDVSNVNDPVERAIQKYKSHPSIQIVKETFDNDKTFSFYLVSPDTIFKEIVSLDTMVVLGDLGIGFGDLVGFFASSRQSDRVYLG